MKWLDKLTSDIAAKVIQQYTGVPSQVTKPVIEGTISKGSKTKKAAQDAVKDAAKGVAGKSAKKDGTPQFDPAQYSPSAGEIAAYDVGLPLLGDTIKAVGNTLAARNSILGAALQAIHNNNSIDNMVQGDANTVNRMLGAGYLGKAAGQKIISDIAANRAYNLADTGRQRAMQERMLQYQAEQGAPGLFYQGTYNMTKSTPTTQPDVDISHILK